MSEIRASLAPADPVFGTVVPAMVTPMRPDGSVDLDAAQALAERARPGDLVITLGAGDITAVGPQVLDLLGGG